MTNEFNLCSRCNSPVHDDNYLQCEKCQEFLHIKCLKHASTPGDFAGDVFFNLTCTKCLEKEGNLEDADRPSTSAKAASKEATRKERLERQHLPWVMVITLVLYNLSIKAKGLSHQGYFHWRTHISNFIDRNWCYLFGVHTRKPRKWIGSISGTLSHNNSIFFLSGQEDVQESGWWKLKHSKMTPLQIYKIYEEFTKKRQQLRKEKRYLNEMVQEEPLEYEEKKLRLRNESVEFEFNPQETCSRAIPYMGRKPKIFGSAKKHAYTDEQLQHKEQQQQPQLMHNKSEEELQQEKQPLSTVQSHLMDFLAENLSNDNITMYDSLVEDSPIGSLGGKGSDFLPLMEAHNDNAHLYDLSLNFNGYNMAYDQGIALTTGKSNTSPSQGCYNSDGQGMEATSQEYSINQTSNDEEGDNDDGEDSDGSGEFKPRIVQITNFQAVTGPEIPQLPLDGPIKEEISSADENYDAESSRDCLVKYNACKELSTGEMSSSEDEGGRMGVKVKSSLPPCKPSLFNKRPQRKWPWLIKCLTDEEKEEYRRESLSAQGDQEQLVLMTEYEEKQLLFKLRHVLSMESTYHFDVPSYIRRFYRKLSVREWKRQHGKPIFNLDKMLDPKYRYNDDEEGRHQLLDRYQLIALTPEEALKTFHARLAGGTLYEMFESPYTKRVLHPFIFRNDKCLPHWLKLMHELQYKVNREYPSRAPIDFCYVRPYHIAAVNALLQSLFWPGIDMSECLAYPDYSVVALYKKLVVGCGFLVPDVGYNEAYISFMAVRPGWQRAGIGSFMLYHLIQTCLSKDITLHVSATNSAIMLYQQFGFKIEEVILNFYDKYFPLESKQSRHALFLRLTKSI